MRERPQDRGPGRGEGTTFLDYGLVDATCHAQEFTSTHVCSINQT
jgi:hypothetical protein